MFAPCLHDGGVGGTASWATPCKDPLAPTVHTIFINVPFMVQASEVVIMVIIIMKLEIETQIEMEMTIGIGMWMVIEERKGENVIENK